MRPLKRWRYIGVYGPDLMCCFGVVTIAGLPQEFWAVWDREAQVLRERTRFRHGFVWLDDGRVRVRDRGVAIDLAFDERAGTPIEVRSPHGDHTIWTRKRAGLEFSGTIVLDGVSRTFRSPGVIDDTEGRHARHTEWCWSAGVGVGTAGEAVAWNLVDGVHDAPTGSERAVWVDGEPTEVAPVTFDLSLTEITGAGLALRCTHEAVRERDDNLIVMRSRYAQPFGTFAGTLPGGLELAQGYGVMERHDVHW
jgi:hypothetical protein